MGSFGCTGDGRATVAFDPALITSSRVYATAVVMRSLDEALAQADQPSLTGRATAPRAPRAQTQGTSTAQTAHLPRLHQLQQTLHPLGIPARTRFIK